MYLEHAGATLVDRMNDFSKLSPTTDTTRLGFDVTSSSSFENDPSRIRRASSVGTGSAFYTYNLTNVNALSAKVFFTTGTLSSRFKVSVSANGSTWTPQTVSFTTPVPTGGGINATTASIASIPVGYNFVRFELAGGSAYWDIQVGETRIDYGRFNTTVSLLDPLNDLSQTWNTSSSVVGFDSSNTEYFEGDTSRLRRQSSVGTGAANFYYNRNGVSSFFARVYNGSGTVSSRFKVFTSPNGSTWTQQTVSFGTGTSTGGGWTAYDATLNTVPAGTNYLRIELSGGAQWWDIQVGRVEIDYSA
jgi:hypothetical protein